MTTIVYQGESKWGRPTYIKLVDDKVIYDDSDGEYGPIEFDIELLSKALSKHYYAQPISYEEWHRRRDIMAMEQDRQTFKEWHRRRDIMAMEQDRQTFKEQMIEFAEFVAMYHDKNKNHKGEMLHAKSKYDEAERTIDLLEMYMVNKNKNK